jgi:hypothetical protein
MITSDLQEACKNRLLLDRGYVVNSVHE